MSNHELTEAVPPAALATQERSLEQSFSQVNLNEGVEASANIAMVQVATFTRGQKKALDIIDRIAEEAMKSVDRKVDAMLLKRYEDELRDILASAENLLAKDPEDVALADFVTAKRDLRRARKNVSDQLQIVDPEMDTDDIDGFFADVDEIINMKRPGALRATHVNIGGRWTKPDEVDQDQKSKQRQSRRSKPKPK